MRTIVLTSRQHRTITAVIEGGVFTRIDNQSGCFFPWVIGQPFHRDVETWAEKNNFLFDGEDLSKKNRKVLGIRVEDVPQGHPLRFMYPNKFR
ncbi:MAG: hypothetical protein NT096_00150 [Proteobacteria bacterium]|nr:hypothetical protein [Pseudomonadota bacterium]